MIPLIFILSILLDLHLLIFYYTDVSQFTDKNSKLMCHNLLIRIPNFDFISTDDLVMKGARASAAMLWDTAKIIVPRTLAFKT